MVSLSGNIMVNSQVHVSVSNPLSNPPSDGPIFDKSSLTAGDIVAAVDFEGQGRNLVEIAALVVKITASHQLQNLNYTRAWVKYPTPEDYKNEARSAKFCHGITDFDSSHYLNSSTGLQTLAQALQDLGINKILGHGDDIADFASKHGFTFLPVNLPPWAVRVRDAAHNRALQAKFKQEQGNHCCNRHNHNLVQNCLRKSKKAGNATVQAKLAAGAHCALYDCFELLLYVHESRKHH